MLALTVAETAAIETNGAKPGKMVMVVEVCCVVRLLSLASPTTRVNNNVVFPKKVKAGKFKIDVDCRFKLTPERCVHVKPVDVTHVHVKVSTAVRLSGSYDDEASSVIGALVGIVRKLPP